MAATLASVCSVPLTSVLLLFELTRDYRILLPLMVIDPKSSCIFHVWHGCVHCLLPMKIPFLSFPFHFAMAWGCCLLKAITIATMH